MAKLRNTEKAQKNKVNLAADNRRMLHNRANDTNKTLNPGIDT